MFVVDLLHEFELGVWKTTFTHIIRVLYAAVSGGEAVADLNERSVWEISGPEALSKNFTNYYPGFARYLLLARAQFVAFPIMLLR